jgi:membrane protein implicated in regulation of membrane protease activity
MLQFLATTSQLGVFLGITAVGVIVLLAGAIFGGEHDVDHDHDFNHDHDHGDVGHNDPTVSIFSTKVLATFVMGFGGAGAMATNYGSSPMSSSLIGLGSGFVLGLAMYGLMRALYSQQSSSLVRTEETLGQSGIVTTGIDPGSVGEVEVSMGSIRRTYIAQSNGSVPFPRGTRVKVVSNSGSCLLVEAEG